MDDLSRALKNYAKLARRAWITIALVLAGFSIVYGASYAVTGNSQVYSPSLDVLKRIPGHMHTHGIIMILLGIGLTYEAVNYDQIKFHHLIRAFLSYSVLVSASIVGSWWTTGKVVFGAPWFWLAFAGIAAALIANPPAPKVLLQKNFRVIAESTEADDRK